MKARANVLMKAFGTPNNTSARASLKRLQVFDQVGLLFRSELQVLGGVGVNLIRKWMNDEREQVEPELQGNIALALDRSVLSVGGVDLSLLLL